MKPSYHQINVLRRLGVMRERFIRRHGYAFRLCDLQGNYLQCLSTPTVNAMERAGLIRVEDHCPNNPAGSLQSWWITSAGAAAAERRAIARYGI